MHLGVRKQPHGENENRRAEDGGLAFDNYTDLLNIVHVQYIPNDVLERLLLFIIDLKNGAR